MAAEQDWVDHLKDRLRGRFFYSNGLSNEVASEVVVGCTTSATGRELWFFLVYPVAPSRAVIYLDSPTLRSLLRGLLRSNEPLYSASATSDGVRISGQYLGHSVEVRFYYQPREREEEMGVSRWERILNSDD